MTFSYYPGCTLSTKAKELDKCGRLAAQALGIDFWTGSQADYDAMASHNATTLYIIVPEE